MKDNQQTETLCTWNRNKSVPPTESVNWYMQEVGFTQSVHCRTSPRVSPCAARYGMRRISAIMIILCHKVDHTTYSSSIDTNVQNVLLHIAKPEIGYSNLSIVRNKTPWRVKMEATPSFFEHHVTSVTIVHVWQKMGAQICQLHVFPWQEYLKTAG